MPSRTLQVGVPTTDSAVGEEQRVCQREVVLVKEVDRACFAGQCPRHGLPFSREHAPASSVHGYNL